MCHAASTLGSKSPVHVCGVKPIAAYNSASLDIKFMRILSHDSRGHEIESKPGNTPETRSGRRWIEYPRLRHGSLRPGRYHGKSASITGLNRAMARITVTVEPNVHCVGHIQRA